MDRTERFYRIDRLLRAGRCAESQRDGNERNQDVRCDHDVLSSPMQRPALLARCSAGAAW